MLFAINSLVIAATLAVTAPRLAPADATEAAHLSDTVTNARSGQAPAAVAAKPAKLPATFTRYPINPCWFDRCPATLPPSLPPRGGAHGCAVMYCREGTVCQETPFGGAKCVPQPTFKLESLQNIR